MNKQDWLKTEGTFVGKAFKHDGDWFFQTPTTGVWALRIGLRVTDDVSEEGKCAVWMGWLSDKALPRTVKTLKEVFGFDGDLNKLAMGQVDFADMPCEFTTANEEYNGKTQLKVKWLNPIGGRKEKTPLNDDALRAFIGAVNAKTKAMAAEKSNEDDIGF